MKIENTKNRWLFLLFIILLALRLASPATANLSFIVLAIVAVLGGKYLIFAFFISWLLTLFNPIMSPESTLASLARYLMILLGLINITIYLIQNKITTISKYLFWLCVLNIILILHSISVSYEVSISILKLLSWFIAAFVLINTWTAMSDQDKTQIYNFIISILKSVAIFSLPLFFIPEIGFARNGTGFQGLLNHPQAFGPTIALLATIIVGNMLSSKKLITSDVIWFCICLVLIILSEARTAGLALFLALLFSILFNPILLGKRFLEANPIFKNKSLYIWLLIILGISVSTYPLYIDSVKNYVFKRTESTTITELADASRGNLVESMIHNINKNPMFGIGFGVASEPNKLEIATDPIFGLPISATIEKGVLPVAVIEELGILIGSLVFLWLFYSIKKSARSDIQKLAIVLCILCLNLGEYMFFSIGGMGMLMLIFFTRSVSD
ncbi:O-antigen ligase family protein [Bisgaard Taxon 45]